MSASLRPHGLWPARLPCPWDSPGKTPGVGAVSSSRGSSQPRDWTLVSCISGRSFTDWATRETLIEKCRADLQCCVGFRCTWKKVIHFTYILFQILFLYRLLQDIGYSSLCCAVGPCCLSTLYSFVSVNLKLLIYPPSPWESLILTGEIIYWAMMNLHKHLLCAWAWFWFSS